MHAYMSHLHALQTNTYITPSVNVYMNTNDTQRKSEGRAIQQRHLGQRPVENTHSYATSNTTPFHTQTRVTHENTTPHTHHARTNTQKHAQTHTQHTTNTHNTHHGGGARETALRRKKENVQRGHTRGDTALHPRGMCAKQQKTQVHEQKK